MSRFIKYFQNLVNGSVDEEVYLNEIKELKTEIEELNHVLQEKNKKINKIYYELELSKKEIDEALKSNKNESKFDSSLLEKLGEEIKARDVKIKTLSAEIDRLKIQNNILSSNTPISAVTVTNLEDLKINYKLLISDFFSERKFESFKKSCEQRGFTYVQELKNLDFSSLKITKTKIQNAKMRYQDFVDKNFDEKMIQYLQYGDLISKVFFRYRSFVKFCQDKELIYISELDNFDFMSLLNYQFTNVQIQKIEDRYQKYIKLKKI